jgi:outer membrane protein insertion porin family
MFYRSVTVIIVFFSVLSAGASADEVISTAEDVFELKKISIGGNRLFSDREIKNDLGLEKGEVYERYLFDYLLDKGIQTIKNEYVNEGYLDVKVNWSFRDVKVDSRKLEVRIGEGERTVLSDVLLKGTEKEDYLNVRDHLGVDSGDPMAEGLLRQGVNNLLRYYGDRGYAKASASYELDRETRTAVYTVEEGNVMTVGIIGVAGNVKTRPKIITREIELKTGDVYNGSKLIKSRENIYKTGLYRDVTIREFFPEEETFTEIGSGFPTGENETLGDFKKRAEAREEKANVVDILTLVQEGKFRWIEVKPGYGSPDRITLSTGWGDNNFLFNNGQSLALRGTVAYGFSEGNYEFGVNTTYTEPWLFSLKYKGVLQIFYERGIYENYNYWETGFEPKVIKELTEHLEVSGGLIAKRSSLDITVDINDPNEGDAVKRLHREAGARNVTSLIFTGTYDSKNDPFNPLKGNYIYFSEETAGGWLLPSDIDFYRIIGDFTRFQQVSPRATIGFHTRAGYVAPFGSTDIIPAYERFFAGGGYSVRGFGERSLGPRDPNDNPIGGRILGYFNLEFRFQLPFVEGVRIPWVGLNLGNFWSGFFLDGGNVWNNLKEIEKEKLRYGAGLGLRYNTPIGPLRFDYAREIDVTTGGGPGLFYLAFGHAF